MAVTITCVIPTVGRPSLQAALDSCRQADEIILVVDDAKAENWQSPHEGGNLRVLHVADCDRGGHTSRNHAMPLATGTHLCFLDDDDIYLPGAIQTMRQHACDRPVIFKMDHPQHGILWRTPDLRFGNVSTQMYLVPNHPGRLGVWEPFQPGLPQPGGDYNFIVSTVAKMGDPVWRDDLVAVYDADRPNISIVTPWLDHPELADDYLAAVDVRSHRDELIVIDNGSQPPLTLPGLRLDANAGFAAASNRGLDHASQQIVLFLNNDVRMTFPDWLETIRNAVEPGVLVGADLRYDRHADVDGQQLPYLDGWCLAGLRTDLDELGGFDEAFDEPAYYSDNDLCLRARLAGMTLRQAIVGLQHLANVTAGPGSRDEVRQATANNYQRYAAKVRDALVAV